MQIGLTVIFLLVILLGMWLLWQTRQIGRTGIFYYQRMVLRQSQRPFLFALALASLALGGITLALWGGAMIWMVWVL